MGADVNQKTTDDGCDAVYSACLWGHFEIVKILVENTADINSKNDVLNYSSALSAAIKNGDIEIVKLLIEKGAIITNSILELTVKLGFLHILDVLHRRCKFLL